MKQEIELIKAIHQYARGRLTVAEVDELWVIFLEDPDYLEWLVIEFITFNNSSTVD